MLSDDADRPWLKHYDEWVPPHLVYPDRPLHEILETTATEVPDRPATSFEGATLTFAELKQRADRCSAALTRCGIVSGDRVGIMLPNCPQFIIATFGVLRLGAVVVSINPAYTPREAQAIANDAGIRVIITLDSLAPLALGLQASTGLERVVVTSLAEYAEGGAPPPIVDGTESLSRLIASAHDHEIPRVAIAPGDLAVLQYTGGTTGTPKGAMLSHRNIFANVIQYEAFMYRHRARGKARYLLVIPYSHIYAFTIGLMCGTWVGALQVLIPKYDVDQALAAIKAFRPTYMPGVPTIYASLLRHPAVATSGLDHVRFFNTGGAPCPVALMEEWERTVGRPLNQGYGLSEASPVTHTTPQTAFRKPGTIGVPVCDTDMKIVDLETGTRELPVGEHGELCVSGPQVMTGYWRQPDETSRALRRDSDGRVWLHTGDVARMDADGFTTIVQRKKDMIIVDGFNVYPSEIEGVISSHPDVVQAACVGAPDPYHGEVVKACVVLRNDASATAEEILAFCRAGLAPYKVPVSIELRDSLPTTGVGKVLYRVLRSGGEALRDA